MAFLDTSKANLAFKAILGKAHTSTSREFANESIKSGITVFADRVWGDTIPPVAATAVSQGVAVQLTGVNLEAVAGAVVGSLQSAYRLKLGGVVPAGLVGKINPLTGVAYQANDYIGSVIPETAGVQGASDYRPILRNNGTEVPPLDASDWVLDPFSGVVVREGDSDSLGTTWAGPMTMDLYVYTGRSVTQVVTQSISASAFIPLAGTGITLTPSGANYVFSVFDYISASQVASLTGSLSNSISTVSSNVSSLSGQFLTTTGNLQTQITNLSGQSRVASIAGLTGIVDISGTGGVTISTSGNTIVINSSPGYNDEQAQDAVGNILANTNSVNFVYSDATPSISASVNVNSDSLEIGAGGVRLKDTITGPRTFSDAITINGNLFVNGTQFIANTVAISAKDNQIVLNAGETGPGVTAGFAGIRIDRGSLQPYDFQFRESDDTFVIGISGGYQAVATREDIPLNGGLAVWNAGASRFDTIPNNFVNISGGSLTGPLTVPTLIISSGGTSSTQSVAINTDVDTGTENLDSFAWNLGSGAMWLVSIKNGSNMRTSTVSAVWDGTTIEFNETSTNDIGNTSGVTLNAILSGANVILQATTTSDNWVIKSHRIMI